MFKLATPLSDIVLDDGVGEEMTSRMDLLPVRIMVSRSMPMPMPSTAACLIDRLSGNDTYPLLFPALGTIYSEKCGITSL
jgi:ABC-type uncharacterized transport system permease subunit